MWTKMLMLLKNGGKLQWMHELMNENTTQNTEHMQEYCKRRENRCNKNREDRCELSTIVVMFEFIYSRLVRDEKNMCFCYGV